MKYLIERVSHSVAKKSFNFSLAWTRLGRKILLATSSRERGDSVLSMDGVFPTFWPKRKRYPSNIILFLGKLCSSFQTTRDLGRLYWLAMDKYRLVQEHAAEAENGAEKENTNNDDSTMSYEVRITQQGKPRNYISYAMKLFVRAGMNGAVPKSNC